MRVERVASLVCTLGVLAFPATADDGAVAPLDVEFLEYLGGLVRDGEGWIHPLDLQRADGRDMKIAERPTDASIEAAEQEQAQ